MINYIENIFKELLIMNESFATKDTIIMIFD